MEAVGLGVGVAGLAGLFSTCISCFELVQRGRYLGKEYLLLETKFANQRLRLLAWGRACGFTDSKSSDERFEDEELRLSIEETLLHLVNLFQDGKSLRTKYGLNQDQPSNKIIATASSALDTLVSRNLPRVTNLSQRLSGLRERMYRTQKNAKFSATARWAIEDQRKFAELVQHMKDLVDDLEGLTRWLDVPERQRNIIEYEVESISDISELEVIEEARCGRIDPVSDAASLRLWRVRDQFLENKQPHEPINLHVLPRHSIPSIDIEWEDIANDAQANFPVPINTDHQTLHRVICEHQPTYTFLDKPGYNTWDTNYNEWIVLDEDHPANNPTALHLCGRRKILDLDAYMKQNSQVMFYVFKTYECNHELSQRRASDSLSFDQSIYLSSAELCSVLKNAQNSFRDSKKPITFQNFEPGEELQAPYLWYYHSRANYRNEQFPCANCPKYNPNTLLEMKIESTCSPPCNRSLQIKESAQTMLKIIHESVDEQYSTVDSLISSGSITFSYLDHLFVENDIIIQRHPKGRDYYQGFKLREPPMYIGGHTSSAALELKVSSWGFDGNFENIISSLTIPISLFPDFSILEFETLPVLPLRYADDYCKDELKHRGKMLWDCRHTKVVTYTGSIPDLGISLRNRRFIIDAQTYSRLHADKATPHLTNDLERDEPSIDEPDFFELLPPTVHGYDLYDHQWRDLPVSHIEPVVWDKHAFDRLVVKPEIKDLLGAVVTSVKAPEELFSNDAAQKEESLVLVFHGAPGTGKSFAAASIAETARRPLYRISCSDIGTDVAAAERYLKSILHITTQWQCVVLLDDADVFLEARSRSDFQRNAMVSVFLRFLEQYNGILILTSNRVGTFDEAFRSRFQLSVHFPPLDTDARAALWRHSLQALNKYEVYLSDLDIDVERFASRDLNGWEIKNVFKMAVQLAQSRREGLCDHHFKIVMLAHGEFKEYMKIPTAG